MHLIAKELAGSDELGLDEQTLLKLFDLKTDNLLGFSTGPFSNQFTFEDNHAGFDQNHQGSHDRPSDPRLPAHRQVDSFLQQLDEGGFRNMTPTRRSNGMLPLKDGGSLRDTFAFKDIKGNLTGSSRDHRTLQSIADQSGVNQMGDSTVIIGRGNDESVLFAPNAPPRLLNRSNVRSQSKSSAKQKSSRRSS